jgi:hypothetical protein
MRGGLKRGLLSGIGSVDLDKIKDHVSHPS